MTFEELGLDDKITEAISYMGFKSATPIQEQAIPEILNGKDVLACAQTGTGKTAAFVLPMLHMLGQNPSNETKALIIVPTRELAIQIDKEIQGFAYFIGISSMPVYGGGDGRDWTKQKTGLSDGANIIVATPGKLISHINLKNVNFSKLTHLILDEADRMLDMGFYDDIMKIVKKVPAQRQNLLFSATMDPKMRKLAKNILNPGAIELSIAIAKPAEGILQVIYLAHDHQKIQLLSQLLNGKENYKSILIFTSTKKKVSEVVRALRKRNSNVRGISSDLDQNERNEVISGFRSKRIRIVVATDVLSRGIDIKDINLVINFDVPNEPADYVHRIGRTARADTTGLAITLVNEDDMYKMHRIEKLIEKELTRVDLPKELGAGPTWQTTRKNPSSNYRRNNSGNSKGRSFNKKRSNRKFTTKK